MSWHIPEVLTSISPDTRNMYYQHTMSSISFGSNNLGNQVGINYGVIHLPPGEVHNA